MKTRIISALVGIPVALAAVFLAGPWVFSLIVAVVAVLALFEYLRFCGVGPTLVWPALIFCAFAVVAVPAGLLPVVPLVGLLTTVVFALWRVEDPARRFRDLVESVLGLAYISYAMGCLLHLRFLSAGPAWILLVLAATWAGDSAAYIIGTRLGKRRLAPRLSPKKTWAGAVGGLAGSLAGGLIVSPALPAAVSLPFVAVVGAVVGLAGQLGDLFESLWKRAKGVKDSGSLIPGHGGILDRLDSLLLGIPVGYHLVRAWGP